MQKVSQITIGYDDGNTVTATRQSGSRDFSLEASDFSPLHTMGPNAQDPEDRDTSGQFDAKQLLWELACALGITAEIVEPVQQSGV